MTPLDSNDQSAGDAEVDWNVSLFDTRGGDAQTTTGSESPVSDNMDTGEFEAVEPSTKKAIPFWLELPILIAVALVVAVVIKTFLFQAFFIPSGSMKETLQIEDRVLVNKISFSIGEIARGNVIVFDDPRPGFEEPSQDAISSAFRNLFESIGLATPQSEFIKRVIGLPGDDVELVQNQLFVNGAAVNEPYLAADAQPPSSCGTADFGPMTVPDGHLMVMGDNRCHSSDGRSFGPVPTDTVVGKAFVIIWPPSQWGGL